MRIDRLVVGACVVACASLSGCGGSHSSPADAPAVQADAAPVGDAGCGPKPDNDPVCRASCGTSCQDQCADICEANGCWYCNQFGWQYMAVDCDPSCSGDAGSGDGGIDAGGDAGSGATDAGPPDGTPAALAPATRRLGGVASGGTGAATLPR